jgi:hypothetical protein
MKKKLIEVSNLESYICRTNARIYVDATMILTPGAKDELSKRKITIVREPKPAFESCGAADCPAKLCSPGSAVTTLSGDADLERLFYGVAAMVKEEYGIDDPQQLTEISCKIVQTLKQTI